MKNLVQDGGTITAIAPYQRNAGECAKIGQLLGVAVNDVANAAEGVFKTEGVFELPKLTADNVPIGAKLWWDDTNRRFTLTNTANHPGGIAWEAASGSVSVVKVKINVAPPQSAA
jgi:predicted RecA/RadA family phage recombinase